MKGNESKKRNGKVKSKHIGRKVGNLVAVMLGASIIAVVSLCVIMFYRLTLSIMEDVCVSGTKVLAYELANYNGPDDRTALLDILKEQMGCEFTIFHGNERAYTTIQQNGQRVIGTKLSDDISKVVLEQGQSYVGQAFILGEKHLGSYVPTKDAEGIKIIQGKLEHNKKRFPIPGAFLQHVFGDLIPLICCKAVKII